MLADGILSGEKIRPGLAHLFQLAHRAVRLPSSDKGVDLGTITLGKRIGEPGHYGLLYEIAGYPSLALKLIHRPLTGPLSVVRQVHGYRLIEPFSRRFLR